MTMSMSSDIAKPLPAQPAQNEFGVDRLATLLQSLDDVSARFKVHAQRLEEQMAGHKGNVETINSTIIINTFVAGVQAQILASTSVKNETTLNVATNMFGFVGLTIVLVGTCIGIAHAVSVRQSMSHIDDILQHVSHRLSEAQAKLEELNRYDRTEHSKDVLAEATGVEAVLAHVVNVFKMLEACGDDPTNRYSLLLEKVSTIFLKFLKMSSRSTVETMATITQTARETPFFICILRSVGLTSLLEYLSAGSASFLEHISAVLAIGVMTGYAVVCLLLSVVCFAAASQPRAVWIMAVMAMCYCLISSWLLIPSLPMGRIHHEIKQYARDSRVAEPPLSVATSAGVDDGV
ncbi:hypothetical protein BV25DRAFT_1823290 [Artomyces pyxidatus]|uniref:Uncharacterized protein n=1 Tax=Artomyces pyxidatus TaxID=48021 RepID=A0ACB8T836_9AGAM|nr:hypothetical protein BV25DRAFT_1823290 [Artomyces pyxidatus]